MEKNGGDKVFLLLTIPCLMLAAALFAWVLQFIYVIGSHRQPPELVTEGIVFFGMASMIVSLVTSPIGIFLYWKTSRTWRLFAGFCMNVLDLAFVALVLMTALGF